jgi:acetyl-CoA carboxylase biotin carboxyl carrier protein
MAKKKVEKAVSSILGVPTRSFENYLKFFNKNNLKELTVREHGAVISLKRDDALQVQQYVMPQNAGTQAVAGGQPSAVPGASAKQPAPAVVEEKHEKITSPIIGTFYEAASPGSPPFVKEGQSINKGDTLCIVEAMKGHEQGHGGLRVQDRKKSESQRRSCKNRRDPVPHR